MSRVFPYGITLHEEGKVALFPAAEVAFHTKESEWLSLFLVVDSGATISALPVSDAQVFGIAVEQGTPMHVYGIGGTPAQGWRHDIRVKLGNEVLTIPFVFLEGEGVPRVLGREGVFDRFLILFDEVRRRTGMLNTGSNEARTVEEILNALI